VSKRVAAGFGLALAIQTVNVVFPYLNTLTLTAANTLLNPIIAEKLAGLSKTMAAQRVGRL
jgi:hypothetical protein